MRNTKLGNQLNYSSLSYIVLVFSSAVNILSNRTLIFHDFQGPTIKFHDFPGLEMKFLNSMTFQDFMTYTNPVSEPCFQVSKNFRSPPSISSSTALVILNELYLKNENFCGRKVCFAHFFLWQSHIANKDISRMLIT